MKSTSFLIQVLFCVMGAAASAADTSDCPPASNADSVADCAHKSCRAIKACDLVAEHAETKSSLASGEAGEQFHDDPDMALSAFKFSEVAGDNSTWFKQAADYCKSKPLKVCNDACADSKVDASDSSATDNLTKVRASRNKCSQAIEATIKKLDTSAGVNDQAQGDAQKSGEKSGAAPASADATKDGAPKDGTAKDATSGGDPTKPGDGKGDGAGAGGGGMPSMPSPPASKDSDKAAAAATPDCSTDTTSPTCAAQWASQCGTATYASTPACQSYLGQHCVGANAHDATCISAKTAQVCADPVGAAQCPVCLRARGIPLSPLQNTVPAICGQIPSAAPSTSGASAGGGSSSSGGGSGTQAASVGSLEPASVTDQLGGMAPASIKQTTAGEDSVGRPNAEVEKQRGVNVFSIHDEVLGDFCKGSINPACAGEK